MGLLGYSNLVTAVEYPRLMLFFCMRSRKIMELTKKGRDEVNQVLKEADEAYSIVQSRLRSIGCNHTGAMLSLLREGGLLLSEDMHVNSALNDSQECMRREK